jgi:thiamine-monophosphate kinase
VTETTHQRVSDLGESGLIDRILERIGPGQVEVVAGGDDTAFVPLDASSVLFTTDALVEGVDFDFAYCMAPDVGWKAVAVNASDIAAMCGKPLWATVSLGLTPATPVATIDGIVEGMVEASARWDIGLVGGDITTASELSLSVAMIGSLVGDAPVLRRGARVGDALLVTGSLGGAAAGLRLLQHREAAIERAEDHPSGRAAGSGDVAHGLMKRQLRPEARVEEAAVLAAFGPSSMIDLSDGLAMDLRRLMGASATGCLVEPSALPLDPGLDPLFEYEPGGGLELAMVGGEDFELLFTLEQGAVAAATHAVEECGTACTRIGTVVEGECSVGDKPLSAWEGLGWDHLRSR